VRRTVQLSFALLVAVSLAAPAAAQQAIEQTAVRVLVLFNPGVLRPGVQIAGRVSGTCFAASLADQGRPDAWRCMSGNRILDPCFEGSQGSLVVLACPDDPWSQRVVVLTASKELPRAESNKAGLHGAPPWALELSNGARCVFLTGATTAVAGMRANYGCTGGRIGIVGDVDRTLPLWRVFADDSARVVLELVGVRVAWY
jgi:hypothetical protein